MVALEIPSLRYVRLRSFTFLLISERSDKCPTRFEHVCVPSPDWLVGAFGARDRWMIGQRRQYSWNG